MTDQWYLNAGDILKCHNGLTIVIQVTGLYSIMVTILEINGCPVDSRDALFRSTKATKAVKVYL